MSVSVLLTHTFVHFLRLVNTDSYAHEMVWAQEHYRISPPLFLAECRKRRLNRGSFVLLCLGCV